MFTHALDEERFLSSLNEVYLFISVGIMLIGLNNLYMHIHVQRRVNMQCLHHYDNSNVTFTIGNGLHRLNVIKNGS